MNAHALFVASAAAGMLASECGGNRYTVEALTERSFAIADALSEELVLRIEEEEREERAEENELQRWFEAPRVKAR